MTGDPGASFIELLRAYQADHPQVSDQRCFEVVKASTQGAALLRQYGEMALSDQRRYQQQTILDDPSREIDRLARDWMDETGNKSWGDAVKAVLAENQALHDRYMRWSMRPRSFPEGA